MSVVTFWKDTKNETGKSLSVVAIATYIAIEHNYKVLVISTGKDDKTIERCYWKDTAKVRRNLGLFGPNTSSIGLDEGIEGAAKMAKTSRLTPQNISNYTKIVYKNHLEILKSYKGTTTEYTEISRIFPEIISIASKYYDYVLVDLTKEVNQDIETKVLQQSDLVVATISQKLTDIDNFIRLQEEKAWLKSRKTMVLIGRYDDESKYNIKNISRYMRERNKISTTPYNTLYFEATEEGKVGDLFLKLRNLPEDDKNKFFFNEVQRAAENIMYRLQSNLQMKM